MTPHDRLDRQLTAGLNLLAGSSTPNYQNDILRQVARTRQRPAWSFLERWLPMAIITRPTAAAPPLRVVMLLLIALLVLALATSVAFVGSQLLRATVPIPQGGAAVFTFGSYEGDESSPQLAGDIFTVRADGTDLRQLTSGPDIESSPVFSPDGTRIAYQLWQDSRNSLVVMDGDGSNAITVDTSDVMSRDCTERWSHSWSPDGMSLIFPRSSMCRSGYDLYVVPTDGSSPAVKLLAPGTNSLYGTWSPDGTQIAFLGNEAGGSVGLFVADADPSAMSGGLRATRIGPDLGPDLSNPPGRPQWSPDGSELVAVGTDGVFVINSDGSDYRVIVGDASNPAWSPDGKQIAFQRRVDPSEYWAGRPCTARTWVIDVDGDNERQLEELGDNCYPAPAWSPDGTRLASVVIAAAPGDPERQVRPGAESSQLWWHLAFVMLDGSRSTVIAHDFSSGSWQPVAVPLPPGPSFAASSSSPAP